MPSSCSAGRAGELLGDDGIPASRRGRAGARTGRSRRAPGRSRRRRRRRAARQRRRQGARAAPGPAPRRRRMSGSSRSRARAVSATRAARRTISAAAAACSPLSASATTAPSDCAPARIGASAASPGRHLRGPVGEPIGHVAPHGRQPCVAGARRDRRGALRRSDDGDRAARGLGREPRHGGEPAAGRDGLDHARVQVAEGRSGRGIVRRGGGSRQGHATAEGASRPFAQGQERACARLAFAMLPPVTRDFTWHDGERIVRFGRGALADAAGPARRRLRPAHHAARRGVGPGRRRRRRGRAPRRRPAASTRSPATCARRSAASCSSRSAAGAWSTSPRRWRPRPAAGAAAIPTTLSAAEMTRGHRHAARRRPGHAARAPADRAQRPGAERLAARGRPRRQSPPTRSATPSRAR